MTKVPFFESAYLIGLLFQFGSSTQADSGNINTGTMVPNKKKMSENRENKKKENRMLDIIFYFFYQNAINFLFN